MLVRCFFASSCKFDPFPETDRDLKSDIELDLRVNEFVIELLGDDN